VLTLLIQLRYQPGDIFHIPADCFFPAPSVDSACATMVRRPVPLLGPAEQVRFKELVKLGFSQRRKMMFKLLKQCWPAEQLMPAFAAVGLDEKIRAEKVSLEQFVALTKLLV
jgi:16S rRNA A1518/A1519 N6-dimethyltransferase RsmA/KsgA/DIM1 with predicted DNA glycosylase/AP lyase activity